MLDLGRADPQRKRAEGAVGRGVAVAADNRGARQSKALLRSDDVADALPPVEFVIIFEPEHFRVVGKVRDLRRAFGIRVGLAAIRRRHVVVDHQQRLFGSLDRKASAPQRAEGLRTVDLVDQVAVDIEQTGAVGLLGDHMVAPDLVVKGVAHQFARTRITAGADFDDPPRHGRREIVAGLSSAGRGRPAWFRSRDSHCGDIAAPAPDRWRLPRWSAGDSLSSRLP